MNSEHMRMRYLYKFGSLYMNFYQARSSWNIWHIGHGQRYQGNDCEQHEEACEKTDFYKKVGKAWKRDDLLYGPLGTEKSSLIAAMTNYLNFDIYYLDLTDIHTNLELRKSPTFQRE